MSDLTDRLYERVLILRCQTGNAAAFAEIVERYDRRVRYFLRKMLKNPADTDDTAQEIWLAVFRGVGRLEDAAAFPAWLYRVARDCVYRELRTAGRRVDAAEADVDSFSADELDFTAEDAAEVHAGLDELHPEAREVLLLRFIEGMSYEEIAEVTSSPTGTVRSRIHYAKKTLRGVLERRLRNESRRSSERAVETRLDGARGDARHPT
jgi:RNA polymerase sigma-70 factor (ECF subfamily)